jgi:DNA-directed RNA polymerase subunit RPC12/RpoP
MITREYKETDWILMEDGDFHVWGCRECWKRLSSHWEKPDYKYCPYCGAERVSKDED